MDQDLIKKFIEGKCNPEEVRAVLKWYQSEDADIQYSKEIEKLVKKYDEGKVLQDFDQEKVYHEIYHKVKQGLDNKVALNQYKGGYKVLNTVYKGAAAILLIVSVAAVFHFFINPYTLSEKEVAIVEYIKKSTTSGQKSTIFLQDGSVITLNSASQVQYPVQFSDSSREVWLNGEAFFQIAEDTSRPFTIHSGNISTTALGTSFNIRAYENEAAIQVALKTGKIKISDQAERIVFVETPNQGITYSRESEKIDKSVFDPKNAFAWKDGILYFKNVGLEEMITKFEEWYGVTFHVKNIEKANDKLFTAEFDNESLYNVLTGLSFSKNFTFQISNDQVYIKFN